MAEPRLAEGRFRAGRVLGGRYEIRSVLGHGGMAEVYLGWDRVLRRRIALKILWEGLARDQRFLARFRREAHAAASLSHPNVVAVHDAGSEDGTPFIVMELVEGQRLSDLILEEAPLPSEEAARIGEAVAAALEHAHRQGIVHRDIKPGNVMLTTAGQVKVVDFGLARAIAWTPVTAQWGIHGTVEYLSPEVVNGDRGTFRSDLYSVGAVLYEMLAGAPPFGGSSPISIAYKHLHEPPRPIREVQPSVPAELEALVMRCLEKAPERRHQKAGDLRVALHRFGARAPTIASVSPEETTPVLEPDWVPVPDRGGHERPRRRRRRRLALVAALVAALAAGAALVLPLLLSDPGAVALGPPRPTPSPTPPPLLAPTGLSAADECDGFLSARITLTWEPTTSSTADGYEIYRGASAEGPYEPVGLVPGRSRARYTDGGLDTGTDYYYLVKATGEGRTSVNATRAHARTNSVCLIP